MRLQVGILVVGSLDWESHDYGVVSDIQLSPTRMSWRAARLTDGADAIYRVRVPIRYGRKSRSRGDTYTMVISPERSAAPGIGKVIRCRMDVTSPADLEAEAKALWAAESNQKTTERISTAWGAVVVLVPPDFLNGADAAEREAMLGAWRSLARRSEVGQGFHFSAADSAAAGGAIIEEGLLKIEWPTQLDGTPLPLDLLLVTVTDPALVDGGTYPDAREIAEAWNARGHGYYFRCNRMVGIETADDAVIETHLR